jgi:hypothetical protein
VRKDSVSDDLLGMSETIILFSLGSLSLFLTRLSMKFLDVSLEGYNVSLNYSGWN